MKKILIAVVSTVLICCCVFGGTLAWLMDTKSITNTFTFGDINITLEETTGTAYPIVPGTTVTKDPAVTVTDDSEDCYLFVKLEKKNNFGTYMTYEIATGWTALEGNADVYYREVTDTNSSKNVALQVLKNNSVLVNDNITKEQIEAINDDPQLVITAYAVQKAEVDTAAEAWAIANS